MRQVGVILELGGHYRGKDVQRYDAAIEELQRSTIGDWPVMFVIRNSSEQPTTVPCFGHNYRCQCQQPTPHGVKRYFSVTLIVEGEPSSEIFRDYELTYGRISL